VRAPRTEGGKARVSACAPIGLTSPSRGKLDRMAAFWSADTGLGRLVSSQWAKARGSVASNSRGDDKKAVCPYALIAISARASCRRATDPDHQNRRRLRPVPGHFETSCVCRLVKGASPKIGGPNIRSAAELLQWRGAGGKRTAGGPRKCRVINNLQTRVTSVFEGV
jgi:hypothetical protein